MRFQGYLMLMNYLNQRTVNVKISNVNNLRNIRNTRYFKSSKNYFWVLQ